MKIMDIVQREKNPTPWGEGDNIPWNDPKFSQRMLKEHLTQDHDAASRRFFIIDQQVGWIHNRFLQEKPARILDLGCGPGLYASRLAKLGHFCVGIDYSPASISYARKIANEENLNCKYFEEDIRIAKYGEGYELVMLIYGEFNVFRPTDAGIILEKAWSALAPGGILLLEPHPYEVIKKLGSQPSFWYSESEGLFSDKPYLCLEECFWDPSNQATTIRYYIVDTVSGEVTRYAQSFQAYNDKNYRELLEKHKFNEIEFYPFLGGEIDQERRDLIAIVAHKKSQI